MDLMLKHDSQLEDVFFRSKSRDYKLEDAIFLRLGHHFKQLIETVGRENLPVTLWEKKELTENQLDGFFLVFESEEQLLL